MTPQQRAEKIKIRLRIHETYWPVNSLEYLAAQIEEAIQEAKDTTHCKVKCGCFAYDQAYRLGKAEGFNLSYELGFTAAREKALAYIYSTEQCESMGCSHNSFSCCMETFLKKMEA